MIHNIRNCQSRIVKVKNTNTMNKNTTNKNIVATPNTRNNVLTNKPKKNSSAYNINQELHNNQSTDLFNELQNKLNNIRFLPFSDIKLDLDKLKNDLQSAESHHPFVNKAIKSWKSIPLRSFDGKEGKEGNEGGGINNSPDPSRFIDTSVMDYCPYIKEILTNLNVPILKVRLMKLEPNNLLPEHVDQFRDDRIFRMHIPIITHPDVLFYVENNPIHIPEATLWYVNVRKTHKVHNKSKNFRVHLVFDIWATDEFILNSMYPAIDIIPENLPNV
jgi:hypothetical protein